MLQIYYFFLLFLFYETEKNVFEIYNSVSVKSISTFTAEFKKYKCDESTAIV